jgi:hypothetical protein
LVGEAFFATALPAVLVADLLGAAFFDAADWLAVFFAIGFAGGAFFTAFAGAAFDELALPLLVDLALVDLVPADLELVDLPVAAFFAGALALAGFFAVFVVTVALRVAAFNVVVRARLM